MAAGGPRRPLGEGALAVLVARDDPLDTFLVHHPEALFGQPVESTVLDPDNPYVLAPHLCAAASEIPSPKRIWSSSARPPRICCHSWRPRSCCAGEQRRGTGPVGSGPPDLTDIRGEGGSPVQIVEAGTWVAARHGRRGLRAHHGPPGRGPPPPGPYVPGEASGPGGLRRPGQEANPPYSTVARDTTSISVLETDIDVPWGDGRLCYGSVEVTNQVVSFLRRRVITGEVLGESKLDLPPRTLRTRAVWWTVTEDQLDAARISPEILGGALHAAEHASIGMLPLFATCDRWDIGGVSIPLHPDTLLPTVFVYDGHPGGAGFAERAFHTARAWLIATRQAIASCECEAGCPSCIQSPKRW